METLIKLNYDCGLTYTFAQLNDNLPLDIMPPTEPGAVFFYACSQSPLYHWIV